MRLTYLSLICLTSILLSGQSLHSEDWTRFRGPNGQGISSEKGLPTNWSATENIAWKSPIPGDGWSSPIVLGNQIFLTTATDEGASCRLICVNREDGTITPDHLAVMGEKLLRARANMVELRDILDR